MIGSVGAEHFLEKCQSAAIFAKSEKRWQKYLTEQADFPEDALGAGMAQTVSWKALD